MLLHGRLSEVEDCIVSNKNMINLLIDDGHLNNVYPCAEKKFLPLLLIKKSTPPVEGHRPADAAQY
jgi:hypothetical protein